jgi:hypothetical protein
MTFMVDDPGYPVHLGNHRTAAGTTFAGKLHGYVLDLHIYSIKHATSNDAHETTCADLPCLTINFNEYVDQSGATATCHASCN